MSFGAAAAAARPPAPGGDGEADILTGHFHLMREFLDSQRRCTELFFNRSPAAAAADAGVPPPETTPSHG